MQSVCCLRSSLRLGGTECAVRRVINAVIHVVDCWYRNGLIQMRFIGEIIVLVEGASEIAIVLSC